MTDSENIKTVISDKSYPVPIEMRPLWRICLIVISVAVASGKNCYLDIKKANILVWMLIRRTRWNEYKDFLISKSDSTPLVSVDTATYKAMEFALAKNFLTLDSGRLHMTQNGYDLYSLLVKNNIMSREVDFLERNGKLLTISKIKELTGRLL